jgi:hypothetical protein
VGSASRPADRGRSPDLDTLIISCRRRGINPQTYLTDVLQRLPAMNITQIAELLPANWQPDDDDAN